MGNRRLRVWMIDSPEIYYYLYTPEEIRDFLDRYDSDDLTSAEFDYTWEEY